MPRPTDPPAPPHVAIGKGQLVIDGEPVLLFGGELQYFRVRDERFDAERTRGLWAGALDAMAEAGMNCVTTYVPWDYHAPGPDAFDFEGVRDLRRFLDLARERGLYIVLKPGPYILAEWPYGFGSYGAVPLWWRKKNPGALVRDARGRTFRWNPVHPFLGRARNTLASYASEAFRQATAEWFEAVWPHVSDLVGPGGPVIGLQLDNETNLFWTDLYRIDHHPDAIAQYHRRLRERYGEVGRLSSVYGQHYTRFEAVRPPARAESGPEKRQRDWIEHQRALVGDYLSALRASWERLGAKEPDVLFFTNDTLQVFGDRTLLLPHGPTKVPRGVYAVDTYPRGVPLPRDTLFDSPYEPEVASRLYGFWNREPGGGEPFSIGLEVQGGHFEIPLPLLGSIQPHQVSVEATRQTLLRLFAHGMDAVVVYTAVSGLNLDGSKFEFQAAIGREGERRPRYAELAAFGRLLSRYREPLLRSRPVTSPLAIVADSRHAGSGHHATGEQRIFGPVLRGLFGWCAHAGLTPDVIDLATATEEELAAYRALLFPCSGAIARSQARRLTAWVEAGGLLIQLLSAGRLGATLFPAAETGAPERPVGLARALIPRSEVSARFTLERASGAFLVAAERGRLLHPPPDADRVLQLRGGGDLALGYGRAVGKGRVVFLATSPGDAFATHRLYARSAHDLQARSLFLRRLLRPTGIRRAFSVGAHAEAHARRDPSDGTVYVFVLSGREAGPCELRLRTPEALGLDRDPLYEAHDIYGDEEVALGRLSGHDLREVGIRFDLPRYGATVVRVRAAGAEQAKDL